FDDTHRIAKVPSGAYDLIFGLFERHTETMYVRKGEKTSFSVATNQVAQPKWGRTVNAKFTLTSDGEEITISPPKFIGQMSEEYVPELGKALNCTGRYSMVYKDKTRFNIDGYVQVASRRFDTQPDGEFKPLVLKRYRNTNDEYEGSVEYT